MHQNSQQIPQNGQNRSPNSQNQNKLVNVKRGNSTFIQKLKRREGNLSEMRVAMEILDLEIRKKVENESDGKDGSGISFLLLPNDRDKNYSSQNSPLQKEQRIQNWHRAFLGRPLMRELILQFSQDLRKFLDSDEVLGDLQQLENERTYQQLFKSKEDMIAKFTNDLQNQKKQNFENSLHKKVVNDSLKHAKERFIKIWGPKQPNHGNQRPGSGSPLKTNINSQDQDQAADLELQRDHEKQQQLEEERQRQERVDERIKQFLMNRRQIQMNKSLEKMDQMIGAMSQDNQENSEQIIEIEKELQKLNDQKMIEGPVIPGKKIQEFVEHWDNLLMANQYDNIEIFNYQNVLPKTLKEFERDLAASDTGHKIYIRNLKKMYECRIQHLKEKTNTRIEALEQALMKEKFQRRKDRERAQMTIGEMESRLLNNVKTVKHIDEFILKCEKGEGFKTVAQAKTVIKKLTEMLIQSKETIQENEVQINELKGKLKKNTNMGMKIKQHLHQENNMRQFYQKLVMKISRDIQVFGQDQRKLDNFNQINEYNQDLKYQYNFKTMLKYLNIEREFINFVNVHQRQQEIIQNFQEYLDDFLDLQNEQVVNFVNDQFEEFGSKKKVKMDDLKLFKEDLFENMEVQFEQIVGDFEEMMDHEPEVIRATSRSGKHPTKMDEEQRRLVELQAIRQAQRNKVSLARRISQSTGKGSQERQPLRRLDSIRNGPGQLSKLNTVSKQSLGVSKKQETEGDNYSYKFSSYSNSNDDKSPDHHQVLLAADSAPGFNQSMKGTDFSQTIKSMKGLSPELKLLRQDSSMQRLVDENAKLMQDSRSPNVERTPDNNMPMSFIPFNSKRLQKLEILKNSQNTEAAELLQGSAITSSKNLEFEDDDDDELLNSHHNKSIRSKLSIPSKLNVKNSQKRFVVQRDLMSNKGEYKSKASRLRDRNQRSNSNYKSKKTTNKDESSSIDSDSDSDSLSKTSKLDEQIKKQLPADMYCSNCQKLLETKDFKSVVNSVKQSIRSLSSTQKNNRGVGLNEQAELSVTHINENQQFPEQSKPALSVNSPDLMVQFNSNCPENVLAVPRETGEVSHDTDIKIHGQTPSFQSNKNIQAHRDINGQDAAKNATEAVLASNKVKETNSATTEKEKGSETIDKTQEQSNSSDDFNIKTKIQNEFNEALRAKYCKYEHLIQKQIEQTVFTGKKFELKKEDVKQLQKEVQESLNKNVSNEIIQELNKLDFGEFIQSFNNIIADQFQKEDQNVNDYHQKDKDDTQMLRFRDVIVPQINHQGFINQFQIDINLARASFLKNGFSKQHLSKLVQACNYVNRLLNDGLDSKIDFKLDQKDPSSQISKIETAIQVDYLELENYAQEQRKLAGEPQKFETEFNQIIREHIIQIYCRSNDSMRASLLFDFKQQDQDTFLNNYIEDVFMTQDQKNSSENPIGISVLNYFKQLFESLAFKIKCLKNCDQVIVEELVLNSIDNLDQLKDVIQNADQLMKLQDQIKVQKDRQTQTYIAPVSHKAIQSEEHFYNEKELIARNLIILDKKLQDQIDNLFHSFDDYLDQWKSQENDQIQSLQVSDSLRQAIKNLSELLGKGLLVKNQDLEQVSLNQIQPNQRKMKEVRKQVQVFKQNFNFNMIQSPQITINNEFSSTRKIIELQKKDSSDTLTQKTVTQFSHLDKNSNIMQAKEYSQMVLSNRNLLQERTKNDCLEQTSTHQTFNKQVPDDNQSIQDLGKLPLIDQPSNSRSKNDIREGIMDQGVKIRSFTNLQRVKKSKHADSRYLLNQSVDFAGTGANCAPSLNIHKNNVHKPKESFAQNLQHNLSVMNTQRSKSKVTLTNVAQAFGQSYQAKRQHLASPLEAQLRTSPTDLSKPPAKPSPHHSKITLQSYHQYNKGHSQRPEANQQLQKHQLSTTISNSQKMPPEIIKKLMMHQYAPPKQSFLPAQGKGAQGLGSGLMKADTMEKQYSTATLNEMRRNYSFTKDTSLSYLKNESNRVSKLKEQSSPRINLLDNIEKQNSQIQWKNKPNNLGSTGINFKLRSPLIHPNFKSAAQSPMDKLPSTTLPTFSPPPASHYPQRTILYSNLSPNLKQELLSKPHNKVRIKKNARTVTTTPNQIS